LNAYAKERSHVIPWVMFAKSFPGREEVEAISEVNCMLLRWCHVLHTDINNVLLWFNINSSVASPAA